MLGYFEDNFMADHFIAVSGLQHYESTPKGIGMRYGKVALGVRIIALGLHYIERAKLLLYVIEIYNGNTASRGFPAIAGLSCFI